MTAAVRTPNLTLIMIAV